MKRCPECSFIYLDADEFCDLDGSLLSYADDREIEDNVVDSAALAVTRAPSKPKRAMVISAAALGLLVGGSLVGVYHLANRNPFQTASVNHDEQVRPLPDQRIVLTPTPAPIESPSPMPTPTITTRNVAGPLAPTRATISRSPVSTTAVNSFGSGHAVIRLTDGTKIEADEVWRTRDGFWYRSGGVVTLIKSNRVRQVNRVTTKE
jgi:hypothetical protein